MSDRPGQTSRLWTNVETGTKTHAIFPDFAEVQWFPVSSRRKESHVRRVSFFRSLKNGGDSIPVLGAEGRIVESEECWAIDMFEICPVKLGGWVGTAV